jgi:hypothetical protein
LNGKSPFLAAIGIAEAMGPVLFDGWNADGQPVGKPWSTVRTPFVKLAAVSETQTQNAWQPLLEMLSGPVVDNYPGLEPLGTFVNLPRGKIEPVTSSASSIKGNKPVFAILDQALALDTPIPTPGGWTTMGALSTGDLVLGSDGPTTVTAAKPVSIEHDCFRVTFADDTSIVASEGHLWQSVVWGSPSAIRTTGEMYRDERTFRIPIAPPRLGWIAITAIEPVPRVGVRCIAVDADDHLFAAGPGGHLTHNTEEWTKSNGGIRMAETMRINAAKLGGSTIESPNAFIPGMGSVAEASAEYYKALIEGRARDDGLLYDHREAPPNTDMTDRESLLAGLSFVYGDSAQPQGWVDLDRIVAEIWDPDIDPQTARADFLNQITHASDSWLSQTEWAGCADPLRVVADRDVIVLGFDGSRHRNRGVTDATALVGCRVEDGHLFLIECWEQPDGLLGDDWWVPTQEVSAVIAETCRRYHVVGFYADPASDWRSFVAEWEAAYGDRLKVQSTRDHPIEWWMGGNNTLKSVRATEQLHSAIVHKNLTHDGGSVLTRHVLNARRRPGRSGIQIAKAHPDSPHKIDAAVAAILAWQCRIDALAGGVASTSQQRKSRVLYRF